MAEETPTNDYILHNDNELTRLNLQHHIVKDALGGKLVLAPINLQGEPLHIIDLCTSDGHWIRDLQASLPNVNHQFVGVDIEKSYFPSDESKNTTYFAKNVNEPLPDEWKNSFDLVHQGFSLAVGGSEENTKALVQRYVQLLKPGGWIQLVDLQRWIADTDGEGWKGFMTSVDDLIKFVGSSLERIDQVKSWLEEFGLVDVEERVLESNFGTRDDKALEAIGKKSGLATAGQVLGALNMLPEESLSFPKSRIAQIKEDLATEMRAETTNAHQHYKVVWGRKPM